VPYKAATVVDADTARVTQFKVKQFQTYGVKKITKILKCPPNISVRE